MISRLVPDGITKIATALAGFEPLNRLSVVTGMGDEQLYLETMREVEAGIIDEALFAKHLVKAQGDREKASYT